MEQSPEARLWIRVITDAILDAVSPARGDAAERDKRQALNFLTDQTGSWAQSREEVCDLVDMCPHRLRTEFQNLMERGATRYDILSMVDGLTRKAQKTTQGERAA